MRKEIERSALRMDLDLFGPIIPSKQAVICRDKDLAIGQIAKLRELLDQMATATPLYLEVEGDCDLVVVTVPVDYPAVALVLQGTDEPPACFIRRPL